MSEDGKVYWMTGHPTASNISFSLGSDRWIRLDAKDGSISWHGMSMDEATQEFLHALQKLAGNQFHNATHTGDE